MTSDVLTVDEAATQAKVSEKTIYRALDAGDLVGSKVGQKKDGSEVGTVWRIFDADLEAWLISLRPSRDANPSSRRSPRGRRRRGDLRALDQQLEGSSS